MTVSQAAKMMELEIFNLPQPDRKLNGAYCGDLLSWVMGRAEPDCAWFTIMSNQNVAAVAVMADISCVILTEGVKPDTPLAARTKTEGINILGTGLSTYQAAALFSDIMK